jgi:glycosyltransferase involved in cell wall biosynthesis
MNNSVSIVIPNRNGEKYLWQTLKSIRDQTSLPKEVVISDNYSSDDSLKIVKKFKDLPIRLVSPPREMTMSEHWNFAIENTSCEWFFLLSNDDLLRKNAVAVLQRDQITVPKKTAIISYRSEIINQNSKLITGKFSIGISSSLSGSSFLSKNLWISHINVGAMAICKSAWIQIGKFPEEFEYLHDLVFFQNASLTHEIFKSPKVLGRYRVYENTIQSLERTRKTEADFVILEKSQFPKLLSLYPQLLIGHEKKVIYSLQKTLNLIHNLGLRKMTAMRHIYEFIGKSGFL